MSTPLLTVKETAEMLRVSLDTAYRLVQTGQVPARRVGGSWRVNAAALDEYLQGDSK
jgi:excisionase family DNA binding protein